MVGEAKILKMLFTEAVAEWKLKEKYISFFRSVSFMRHAFNTFQKISAGLTLRFSYNRSPVEKRGSCRLFVGNA